MECRTTCYVFMKNPDKAKSGKVTKQQVFDPQPHKLDVLSILLFLPNLEKLVFD